MVLSHMLNRFGVQNRGLERSNTEIAKDKRNPYEVVQSEHPKANYIGFRTCEILKDLGIG